MRYIAIFLLLANMGYFGWNHYRPQSMVLPVSAESRPLLNSGLILISEYQQGSGAEADSICYRVGNFTTVDEANGFIALAETKSLSARLSLSGEPLSAQYRVYLPPVSSRAIATMTLDALSERIVEAGLAIESYLITRGLLENGIALGVFADLAGATEVQNQLSEFGYGTEIDEIPRSSGDIRVELTAVSGSVDQTENVKWLELATARPYLTLVENLCETIAQGSQFP
jgi:hypothetical protein